MTPRFFFENIALSSCPPRCGELFTFIVYSLKGVDRGKILYAAALSTGVMHVLVGLRSCYLGLSRLSSLLVRGPVGFLWWQAPVAYFGVDIALESLELGLGFGVFILRLRHRLTGCSPKL